ncbi:MAG: PilZ domain-containing protein [Syntrophobacteraceae bacterium]|jgi:Tfp pilus assembly protein PilZ|nr:PilZ domain-containing protein [Syntrophobacteraceae bacterium]
MVDRRFYTRLKRSFRIRWKDRDLDFLGVTGDLCPGGVFVVTDTLLPVHTVLDMEIWLERELPARCRGEVIWINRGQVVSYPPGFGVQFIDLSDDVLAMLLMVCGDPYGAGRLYAGLS